MWTWSAHTVIGLTEDMYGTLDSDLFHRNMNFQQLTLGKYCLCSQGCLCGSSEGYR